jgi:serine/threonine-protein kinase RsbW
MHQETIQPLYHHNNGTIDVFVEANALDDQKKIQDRLLSDLREKYGQRQELEFAVKIGLDEAYKNAIKHGNEEDLTKRVFVHYMLADDFIVMQVKDQGNGFDLTEVPDPTKDGNLEIPSGRGILLMNHYFDEVTYNRKGTKVTLKKIVESD